MEIMRRSRPKQRFAPEWINTSMGSVKTSEDGSWVSIPVLAGKVEAEGRAASSWILRS